MTPFRWIIVAVVVLVAIGGALWYFLAGGGPKLRAKTVDCDELKARLVIAQGTGDANAIAQLQRQIEACDKTLVALGDETADPIGTRLAGCVASFDLIYPSLSDIIATDRSDWLKRGNIWRNALHFATDATQCLTSVATSTTTKEDMERLRTIIRDWGIRMRAVQNRLYAASHGGESGLDAYSGSPEPGGDDKAHAWKGSVVDPLWVLLGRVDNALSALDPSNAALTAELAAVSATPSPPADGVFGP